MRRAVAGCLWLCRGWEGICQPAAEAVQQQLGPVRLQSTWTAAGSGSLLSRTGCPWQLSVGAGPSFLGQGLPARAALCHWQDVLGPLLQQQQQQQCGGGQLQWQAVRHFQMRPRRTRYRKAFKSVGFNETICPNTRQLAFGAFGIRAMEHGRLPAKTIEAARRALRRTVKKTAMLWIRVTPNVPVTSKPAEVRMGKGKGTVDFFAAPVRPGQIMFELDRVTRKEAMNAVMAVQPKLPMKIGFVEWR